MGLTWDEQQQKCYDFEANFVEPHDKLYLSKTEIQNVISRISKNFGIAEPKVRFKNTNAHCKAFVLKNEIHITNWGRRLPTVLHELAHILDYQFTKGKSGMGHGPLFMGISIFLYAEFMGLNYQSLYYSALDMGLKVEPVGLPKKQKKPSSDDFFNDDF